MRRLALLLLAVPACAPTSRHVETALAYGHLPPLPAGATEVCVDPIYNRLFPASRTYRLRFRVSDAEAEAFLAASPELVPLESNAREQVVRRVRELDAGSPCAAPSSPGRVYEAPGTSESTYGNVLWDEENDVLFVETHYS